MNTPYLKSDFSSILQDKKRHKKSMVRLGGVSLNALLLAGCGGGTSPTPQPQTVEAPASFTQSGSTFTSTGNTDSTLTEGSSTADLTVTSEGGNDMIATGSGSDTVTTGAGSDTVSTGAGDDTIIAGTGNDLIYAGEGSDNIQGGEGNDTIVLVGTTTAGQYSSSSITNSAGGADMSGVLTTDSLNNNTVSEVGAGEIIDGGSGTDSLVIYGTAYINQATLLNLDEMWVNSEVILTGEQFTLFGAFKGDGASVLRVRSNDLEHVTAENDATPGGNRGHGNNTDGQDDNNPGQGSGGPNIHDKDNIDTDETNGDTTIDGTTPIDGTTTIVEPTIVDISSIYMEAIGTLSLEGTITLLADDMHDFAGITNVNGDGTTNIILNGNPDLITTDFDLSAVNLSGIAELELNGNFNIIVSSANDYFGIGSIAVSAAADITLTIDSSDNVDFTAAYDFTTSGLAVVDNVKVYGDTKLTFTDAEQLAATQITGVTDSLTIAFTGAIDGSATELLASSLATHLYGVDALELAANVTLIIDDQTTLAAIGIPAITGFGTVIIDRTAMSDDALVSYLAGLHLGPELSVLDTSGNDLQPLIPVTEITGTAGDDIYTGEDGKTVFVFTPVDGNFGYDIVNDFELGNDKIDLAATLLNFDQLEQTITADGLQIITPQGWILVSGLTAPLNANNFILHDITGPVISQFSLSHSVDMDVNQLVYISVGASDSGSSIATVFATFTTPSGDELEISLSVTNGDLGTNGGSGTFDASVFTEEGIYTLTTVTVTDINGNVTTQSGNDLTPIGDNTTVTVFNTEAINISNIISGDNTSEILTGTESNDTFVGRGGDDTLTGNGGNDTFSYLSGSNIVDPVTGVTTFDANFGIDTITDFDEGDTLNFSATDWSFNSIKIYYRGDSTEVVIGENKVVLEGFTGVLTNIGTYDDPVLVVMSEAERLDANHEGDVRPPSVDGITVPATVNLDEDVRFYFDIDVSDDISGTNYVHLRYHNGEGSYFYTYAYNSSDFEGWTTLNEWFAPGTYSLDYMWGRDNANNEFSYNITDIETLGISSSIEVTNSNPDLLDPVINSISLDQTVVDLGLGDTIFATIDATDDMSGVDNVQLRFIGPDGDHFYTQFRPETGMVTELNINPYFTSGTYTVDYAWITDNAGNQPYLSGQALIDAGLNVSFELINPNPDEEAPTLVNVSSENDLTYVIGVNDNLIIDAMTADNLSGTYYNYLTFTNEEGYSKTFHNYNNDHGENTVFSEAINADLWPEGTYSLTSSQLEDHAQNYTYSNAEELAAAQIFFSFDVVAPLKITGTVEDDLLIGGDGYDLFVMSANFGNDTIEAFTLGEDYVDLRATTFEFGAITQSVTADGLLITAGSDSVLVTGLTAALSDEYLLANGGDNSNLIPTLTGISLASSNIDATDGASIDISITVENPNTNLNYGYLQFTTPDNGSIYHYIESHNDLAASDWLSEWTDAGVYTLDYVYLQDSNGTSTSYNSTQLTDLGFATSYTVTNATEDNVAPTLTDFTISAASIEVGVENVLNFTASGTDANSGIASFTIQYSSPSGNTWNFNLSGNHQFIGGSYFSDWSEAGTYTIDYIIAHDVAGNTTTYDTATLASMSFATTFEVTNANNDDVAPVLTGLTLGQVYLTPDDTGTDPLIANLTVDETGSGYSYSYIYYNGENGGSNYGTYSNSLANSLDNTTSTAGIYSISQVNLYDLAGNSTVYNANDLETLGLNPTFRLLGDGTQPGVAVAGTSGIDDVIGTTGDEVFTLYLGTDTVSFGANWGHDTVADFVQGDDVLDFSGSGLTYADLTINDTSYGLFINDANGNDLLLQGFEGELQAGDAIFATTNGTFGVDTITAGPLESIDAGPGDDIVTVTDDNFNSVNGGSGVDTLAISGDGLDGIEGLIDLAGLVARGAVLNFETIDISNPDTDDTLLLTADQVVAMTDTGNVMVINGDVGDTLNSQGEGWVSGGTTVIGGVDYNVYTSGLATIHVDPEMELILS